MTVIAVAVLVAAVSFWAGTLYQTRQMFAGGRFGFWWRPTWLRGASTSLTSLM